MKHMLGDKHTTQDRAKRTGPVRRVRAALTTDRATTGLVAGRLVVAKEHVVFVKGVVEASEGLACLFAERGGDLTIASPVERRAELRELLIDLASDLGGTFDLPEIEGEAIDRDAEVDAPDARVASAPPIEAQDAR